MRSLENYGQKNSGQAKIADKKYVADKEQGWTEKEQTENSGQRTRVD
jgi:hypothetical protein